jgi:hypothetical protein
VLSGVLPELTDGAWTVLVSLEAERWTEPRPTGVRLVVSPGGRIAIAPEDPRPVTGVATTAPTAVRRVLRRVRRRAGGLRRRVARLRESWRR